MQMLAFIHVSLQALGRSSKNKHSSSSPELVLGQPLLPPESNEALDAAHIGKGRPDGIG